MKPLILAIALSLGASSCGSSDSAAAGDQSSGSGTFYSCDSSDSSKVTGATSPFGPNGQHVCIEVTLMMASDLSQPKQACEGTKGSGLGFSASARCAPPAVGCYCYYNVSNYTSATYEYDPNAAANAQTEKEQCAQLPRSVFKCYGVPGF